MAASGWAIPAWESACRWPCKAVSTLSVKKRGPTDHQDAREEATLTPRTSALRRHRRSDDRSVLGRFSHCLECDGQQLQVAISVDAAELLLRFQDAGGGPAQDHG